MNYITFNEVIEVNGLLEEKGLNFKVHLRDACGKQSCWIEPLGNCACEGRYEEMYQVVEEYFESKGQKIEFDETKLNFFVGQYYKRYCKMFIYMLIYTKAYFKRNLRYRTHIYHLYSNYISEIYAFYTNQL